MEGVLNSCDDERPEGCCGHRSGREETKTDSEHEQKVPVTFRDHLVNGDLHIERAREDKNLEQRRKYQDLQDCMRGAARTAPELAQRKASPLVPLLELLGRC